MKVPFLLTKLRNAGGDVDFSLPWAVAHGGDYDLDKMLDWADNLAHSAH